jgi:hypothetical protein
MAIKGFKDIIDKKGYRVSKKDRSIIERELQKSLFGVGNGVWFRHGETDAIEFVLYDSNDNKLPQGEDGRLVRYIYLDDANIREYFIINEDETTRKQINDAREYVVDSEKLIKDAGYSNGIFKTQITLINRRVGSEERPFDKLWIHEISPSRTEIRVLPTKDNNDKVIPDLQERYNIFTSDKNFRDDTILAVRSFVDQINVQEVLENFLKIKGKVSEGQGYVNLIKKEFGVSAFDIYLNRVKNKYIQAMDYYAANREHDVFSLNYGKPLAVAPQLDLSIDKILAVATDVLQKIIDKELPKRNLQSETQLSKEDQISFDKVQSILKNTTDSSIYDSTIPPSVSAVVRGCTNPDALNYNPLAVQDDGSCILRVLSDEVPLTVLGCTDRNALNYNPLASKDDGSCRFDIPVPETITKRFYVHSTTATARYVNRDGGIVVKNDLKEYDEFSIRYLATTTPQFTGDIREYPKKRIVNITRCGDISAQNYGEVGECVYTPYTDIIRNTDIRVNGDVVTYPILNVSDSIPVPGSVQTTFRPKPTEQYK